jgi:hypothetical protein
VKVSAAVIEARIGRDFHDGFVGWLWLGMKFMRFIPESVFIC